MNAQSDHGLFLTDEASSDVLPGLIIVLSQTVW